LPDCRALRSSVKVRRLATSRLSCKVSSSQEVELPRLSVEIRRLSRSVVCRGPSSGSQEVELQGVWLPGGRAVEAVKTAVKPTSSAGALRVRDLLVGVLWAAITSF
ncbi:hypothetical protein EC991_009828, partial [Linnemannia zychae]